MSRDTVVGIVAPSPGDSESDSGHIATRMLINILLHFHAEVHVFTRGTVVFEFSDDRVSVHEYDKPFANASWYLRLPGSLVYQLRYAAGIARRPEVDMLIFGGTGFLLPAVAAKLRSIHVLFRIGGVTFKDVSGTGLRARVWAWFLWTFQVAQYTLVDTVVVMSPQLADFAELDGFEQKVEVWNHYYFDLAQFTAETPYAEREPVIGHIGVSTTKGTLTLLRAFDAAELSETHELLVVGHGPQMAAARAYAEEAELNVRFTGFVDRGKIQTYYDRMRLFVNCSQSEGVPKTIFEAMGCRVPVLAAAVGGIPDYVTEGETGFLLSETDVETLAARLREVVASEDLPAVSENGHRYVEDNFSYHSTVHAYHDLVTTATDLNVPEPPAEPAEPIPQ